MDYDGADIDELWTAIESGDKQALGELVVRFNRLIAAEAIHTS